MRNEEKLPFDIETLIERIRYAVRQFPKAAMFELADRGYNSIFEQLIACIISIRTYDEVTVPTALRLFERAKTPSEVSSLSYEELDNLIHDCTFHENKTRQILEISRRIVQLYNGKLCCNAEVLMSFSGVGIKCANLVLGIACGIPKISVDIHVHRITNRWGYIRTPTPEKSTTVLEKILPQRYWIEINKLLVPFGKHICTGNLPKCSICPVLKWCRQVGVTSHR